MLNTLEDSVGEMSLQDVVAEIRTCLLKTSTLMQFLIISIANSTIFGHETSKVGKTDL